MLKEASAVAPRLESSIMTWLARWVDGKATQCAEMVDQAIDRYGELDEETQRRLASAFELAYVNDEGQITIDPE